MSQALHLLKKDLRALWLPLLLLYIVLAAQTAIILRDPLIYDLPSGLPMLQLLFPLATVVTAAMLVHQEPLVGTTAFWMTRPIRRSALLLSKTLFLLVFVVTPSALATLRILFAYGMDSGPAGSALGGFLPSLGGLLVGAVLVASVTPNVPTYLTAWISLILTSVLLNTLLDKVITANSTAVEKSVFLFLGGLLIFHQYFTRRTRRTVIGLGVAYFGVPLLSTLLITLWIVRARGPAENPDVPTGGPVAVGLGTILPSGVFPASSQVGSETTFSAIPEILKAPPGLDVAIQFVHGNLWVGGSAYARVRSNNTPLHFDAGAIEAAMPGFRWIGKPRSPEVVSFHVTLAGDSAFDDLIGKPTTLRAIVPGGLYAYRLAGAIPLVSGARFESGTKAAVIGSVSRGPSSVQLDLRTRYLTPSEDERFPRILLLNRRREEMIEGDGSHDQARSLSPIGLFAGLTILASEQRLTFPSSANRGRVNLDDEWLREAELAFLEWVPEGHFRTQIEVNDFRMVDTTITPNAMSSGGAE